MSAAPLDLITLRRGCASCTLMQLCLPAGIGREELQMLEDIVKRKRPVEGGERLFRQGDAMGAVFVARDGAPVEAFSSSALAMTAPATAPPAARCASAGMPVW